MIKRRRTRQVKVGGVKIGGNAPISVQAMTKVETDNVAKSAKEINRLQKVGCEIVRVAVKNLEQAKAIRSIKSRIDVPLVADIHFNYQLALKAIESGADKVRLNPGNISRRDEIASIVTAAKKRKIPIRIGVNSGSLIYKSHKPRPDGRWTALSVRLAKSALGYVKIFENLDFYDIVVSLKASDVISTVEAHERLAGLCDYPFHLGVTASGTPSGGVIKSSIGIGALLLKGIGDTIRVSLTSESQEEVVAAKKILSALELRDFGPEVISCPTCGRCEVDLIKIVGEFKKRLDRSRFALRRLPFKIAIMGCEVNGPGEACEAELGLACGRGWGVLFRRGKIIRKIKENDFVKELLREVERF